MSDFRPALHPLEVGGVVYEVRFSLATLDAIYSEYGDMKAMLRSMGIPDAETLAALQRGEDVKSVDQAKMIRAICFLIAVLVNDDLDERGEPVLSAQQIMRRLSPGDVSRLQGALVDIISDGMPKPESGSEKNA